MGVPYEFFTYDGFFQNQAKRCRPKFNQSQFLCFQKYPQQCLYPEKAQILENLKIKKILIFDAFLYPKRPKSEKMDFGQNGRPKLIFCQDSKQYELTGKIFFSGALKCVNQVTNLISSIFGGKIAFSENFVDAWSKKIFKKSIFFDFLKNALNHI